MARLLKFLITFGITFIASYLVLRVFSYCSFSNGYSVNSLDTLACTIIAYISFGVLRVCILFDFLNTAYKYPQYISIFKSCWAMDGLYRLNDKEKELQELMKVIDEELEKRQAENNENSSKDEDDKNGTDVS